MVSKKREEFDDFTKNEFDLGMIEKWVRLAFEAGLFGKYKEDAFLTLKTEDYRGFTYFVRRVPTARLKQTAMKQVSKEEQIKRLLQNQQLDLRPNVLQHLDTRPLNMKGAKLSGATKDTKIIKRPLFDPEYRPAPLPKELSDKLAAGNPKWLDKVLDEDAEKPDDERRYT